MPSIPLIDVAIAFFIGMGPIKIVGAYLAVTHGATLAQRRQVAILTVAAATATAVVLVVSGVILLQFLHLSNAAMVISASIVMLAVGLRTVLEPNEPEERPVPSHAGLLRQAIHPLAVPTLLNPAGIAAAILLSAEIATSGGFVGSLIVILAVAALDLAVLLAFARIGHRVGADVVVIVERVFGMLLVAVAIQLLLYGLAQIGVIDAAFLH